jgi:hypothetical protein
MALVLRITGDANVSIVLDEAIAAAWRLQVERMHERAGGLTLAELMEAHFNDSLLRCLDDDLRPPTAAQIGYATAISRELGVGVPCDALRHRGDMSAFIGRYASVFRERRVWVAQFDADDYDDGGEGDS